MLFIDNALYLVFLHFSFSINIMLKKTTLKKINNWISEGYEKRNEDASKECCDYFMKAWAALYKNAPKSIKDFTLLVEKYNQDETDYDWGGWIWEVGEELGIAGKHHPECMEDRIEFIEAFKERFSKTSDEELMEYLQRTLIKTNFLMGNDNAGEKAVNNFYKQIDYSVWGYIEWGDALINRAINPSKAVYQQALTIYQKGLDLEDDEAFMDVLRERIERVEQHVKQKSLKPQ